MDYKELKDKVRTKEITEITSPHSNRTFQIRWDNHRLETLAPPSLAFPNPTWQPRTPFSIRSDFLSPLPEVNEDILDLLDFD